MQQRRIAFRRCGAFLRAALPALSCYFTVAMAQVAGPGTVVPSEIGSMFAEPNGFQYADLGAALATSTSGVLERMSPVAIKIAAARFHIFKPSDDAAWSYFPYRAFTQYEADEIAAGRPPLFVLATYRGKARRVLWKWSLDLKDNRPTAPPSEWRYAVNVRDVRFVNFWIDRYVRRILLKDLAGLQNVWVGLDECAFNWELYGVLDDDGQFVSGIHWDAPFPGGEDEYLSSVQTFFSLLTTLAPDIHVACNLGSMRDESRFRSVFRDVPGIMLENILDLNGSPSGRHATRLTFENYEWFGSMGRVALCRALVKADDLRQVRDAVLVYLLIKGQRFFFAPQFDNNTLAVPPARYAELLKAFGSPAGPLESSQPPGASPDYRLYWRKYDNGIVYMNWSGAPQTVVLPGGRLFFDPDGRPVSRVRVSDGALTYVLSSPGRRAPVRHDR
jgi:hypothetical protein